MWDGARDAWLRFSALRPFLDVVHSGMSPTAYDGAYTIIDEASRACGRDDARRARAHPSSARRLGACAADCLRRSSSTHRLAAFSIRFRSGLSPRGSAWCCSRRWPATVTTPTFSSGHSSSSMHRPSSGRCFSSSADCQRRPFNRRSPSRTLIDAGRRNRHGRGGAPARRSGPTPLCLGHAALRHQARTRVHRRSGIHQNARCSGRHLCPHSDGPDEQAGRRCDEAGGIGWSAGLPGAGEHPGQQQPGTPACRRATSVGVAQRRDGQRCQRRL